MREARDADGEDLLQRGRSELPRRPSVELLDQQRSTGGERVAGRAQDGALFLVRHQIEHVEDRDAVVVPPGEVGDDALMQGKVRGPGGRGRERELARVGIDPLEAQAGPLERQVGEPQPGPAADVEEAPVLGDVLEHAVEGTDPPAHVQVRAQRRARSPEAAHDVPGRPLHGERSGSGDAPTCEDGSRRARHTRPTPTGRSKRRMSAPSSASTPASARFNGAGGRPKPVMPRLSPGARRGRSRWTARTRAIAGKRALFAYVSCSIVQPALDTRSASSRLR